MFKTIIPLFALAVAGTAFAQTADPGRFYKLDFVVKEVEGGKTVNSRSYSTMVPLHIPGSDASRVTIRAGGRVPVSSGTGTQFFDLGVNLDVRDLRETQGEVSLFISADISTILQESPGANPVVRQNRWSGSALVPLKKSTVVFASDDLSSKRQLQLELTATPIK